MEEGCVHAHVSPRIQDPQRLLRRPMGNVGAAGPALVNAAGRGALIREQGIHHEDIEVVEGLLGAENKYTRKLIK